MAGNVLLPGHVTARADGLVIDVNKVVVLDIMLNLTT